MRPGVTRWREPRVACPALRALGMVSKGPLLRLLTAINRRRMKLLVGLACIAYVACE